MLLKSNGRLYEFAVVVVSGGVDLVDAAFLYLSESRYPNGCSDTCKRVIKKKAGMFVICEE